MPIFQGLDFISSNWPNLHKNWDEEDMLLHENSERRTCEHFFLSLRVLYSCLTPWNWKIVYPLEVLILWYVVFLANFPLHSLTLFVDWEIRGEKSVIKGTKENARWVEIWAKNRHILPEGWTPRLNFFSPQLEKYDFLKRKLFLALLRLYTQISK